MESRIISKGGHRSHLPSDGEEFDYIIVGGGAAGCLIANRLIRHNVTKDAKILLLEAGDAAYSSEAVKVPYFLQKLTGTSSDWAFRSDDVLPTLTKNLDDSAKSTAISSTTASEEKEDGKRDGVYLIRGKGLGGSTCANVSLYLRGAADDFDKSWKEEHGLDRWGSEDVLPYFQKHERHATRGESKFHSPSGEWDVQPASYRNSYSQVFLDACAEKGSPLNADFNNWSRSQVGHGAFDLSQHKGRRVTAASAFLDPILEAPNFVCCTGTPVQRLMFDNEGKRVVGVEYQTVTAAGACLQTAHIKNGGEVLLASGAIHTPQLLLVSGIGPEAELKKHGIPVLIDLPGVGQNLQDHPSVIYSAEASEAAQGKGLTSAIHPNGDNSKIKTMVKLRWRMLGTGPLTSVYVDHGAFYNTKEVQARAEQKPMKKQDHENSLADLQVRFAPIKVPTPSGNDTLRTLRTIRSFKDGFTFQFLAIRPHCRGAVTLRSASMSDKPCIKLNLTQDKRDMDTLRAGLRMAREYVTTTAAFASIHGEEVFPGKSVQTDDEYDAYIRATVHSGAALVGTCRMGGSNEDTMAVVDDQLRLRGCAGVRICDASVMPTLPGGQVGSTVLMIAERACDFLLSPPKQSMETSGRLKHPSTEKNQSASSKIGDMLKRQSECEQSGALMANFAVGNPSIEPPESFRRALRKVVLESTEDNPELRTPGRFKYTSPAGLKDLRHLLADHIGPSLGARSLSSDHIVITPGAQSALVNACKTLIEPGDVAILHKPIYPEFKNAVETWQGTCSYVSCDANFDLDLDVLRTRLHQAGKRAKMIILCSPGNPSGKIISEEATRRIAAAAQEHRSRYSTPLWIVFDYTYWRLSHDMPVARAFECYDDAIMISSFSKDVSIPGERVGYIAVNPRSHKAKEMNVVPTLIDNNVIMGNISPPSMVQHALVEVLKTNKGIPTNLDRYQAMLQPLLTLLSQVGFEDIRRPDGGFYVFAKLPSGVDDISFASSLMEQNVFLLPGTIFGMPGYLRFCALVPKDSPAFAMAHDALKKAMAKPLLGP